MAPSPHKTQPANGGRGSIVDQASTMPISSSSSSTAIVKHDSAPQNNRRTIYSTEKGRKTQPIWSDQNLAHKEEELDEQLQTARWIKDFLCKSEGSALRAWLRHFDQDNDQKISASEFMRGMQKLEYPGDVGAIFAVLDHDHSGELSLEEIDAMQAILWRRFRQWASDVFEGPDDFIAKISCSDCPSSHQRRAIDAAFESVDLDTFVQGVRRLGWQEGYEELLFSALDVDNCNEIMPIHLRWLAIDHRKQERKEAAKKLALHNKAVRKGGEKDRKAIDTAFNDFKSFLKRKFGHFVRAWRRDISPEGSLTIHKKDLFKACNTIGWGGDVRLLWAAFDKDGSGDVSIEELDPKGAALLAHFKEFAVKRFGNTTAAFRALDKFNLKKLKKAEFLSGLKGFGFDLSAKSLFCGLDLDCKKHIVEENLYFLDRWKPPGFLTAKPSRPAADEFKAVLLKAYKNNCLTAWRHFLDTDGSNHCNWGEFSSCCKRLGFGGDVGGAWRALDEDMSGYITLGELDAAASATLGNFKRWCDEEFGGVRSAFSVFDNDGSNEVSYREFRRTCRAYGFDFEDPKAVFQALDTQNNGTLGLEEVVFLDDWHFQDREHAELEEEAEALPAPREKRSCEESLCTSYETDGPGPNILFPPTLGSGPAAPMLRFSGAFTLRKRTRLPQLNKDKEFMPSPQHYDAAHLSFAEATARSKPAFSWGSAPQRPKPLQRSPGPGAYGAIGAEAGAHHGHRGVAAICSPRRPLKVHPLFRGHIEPRPLTVGAQPGGPWSARLPPRIGC